MGYLFYIVAGRLCKLLRIGFPSFCVTVSCQARSWTFGCFVTLHSCAGARCTHWTWVLCSLQMGVVWALPAIYIDPFIMFFFLFFLVVVKTKVIVHDNLRMLRVLLTEELQYFGEGTFSVQLDAAYKHFLGFCRSRRLQHSQAPFVPKMVSWQNCFWVWRNSLKIRFTWFGFT